MTPKKTRPKKKPGSKKPAPELPPEPVFKEANRQAKLKNITGGRRAQIVEWFYSPGGVPFCLRQIKKRMGIRVSQTVLYETIELWKSQHNSSIAVARSRIQLRLELEQNPDMTPEQQQASLERSYLIEAAAQDDKEMFLGFAKHILKRQTLARQDQAEKQKLKQREKELDRKERELQLSTDKWQTQFAETMLSSAMRLRAERISKMPISNAAKIRAMREALFADVDALAASNRVTIPD